MAKTRTEPHHFVTYLESLAKQDNRGALAALRRGLGQPPGTVLEMYRYVVPQLPSDPKPWVENAYYLVASLFALYPKDNYEGDVGAHLAGARDPKRDNDALERRFVALLNTHSDELPFVLRQTISFLRSKEVPVNWHQLIRDLQGWNNANRYVQKKWANAFWGRATQSPDESGD